MHIEDRGLISDAGQRPADHAAACSTALCRLRSGTILASFQTGPVKQAPTSTLRLCRSDDGGRHWRDVPVRFESQLDGIPGSLAAGELVETSPGELRLFATWFDRREPDRPLFDPATEGILRSRQLTAESTDVGESWSAWQVVPTPGLSGCAISGPLLQWDDGTLAYSFESFKEFDDPRPAQHAAWLLLSRDGGRTFPERRLVARDPQNEVYFWDQRLCVAGPRGEYIGLFWTHDRARQQDLRVHWKSGAIGPDDSLADDARPAAARPTETSLPGQIAAPLLLGDGRLLAFVVDRARPGTMTLWTSPDSGRTWPAAERLVVYTHDERALLTQGSAGIDFAEYWEDMCRWTFGHPALRDLGDGRVLLAWYAGPPGALSVHWARVAV